MSMPIYLLTVHPLYEAAVNLICARCFRHKSRKAIPYIFLQCGNRMCHSAIDCIHHATLQIAQCIV